MIRQMGISPGIMDFQTFGTLNHPTPHAHVYRVKRDKKEATCLVAFLHDNGRKVHCSSLFPIEKQYI